MSFLSFLTWLIESRRPQFLFQISSPWVEIAKPSVEFDTSRCGVKIRSFDNPFPVGMCTGNHILTTISYYGVATNLVLYLTQVLHEGNSSAAANYSNWLGTSYLMSLVGAFLGDAYWGRYWTAIVFSTINLFVSSHYPLEFHD